MLVDTVKIRVFIMLGSNIFPYKFAKGDINRKVFLRMTTCLNIILQQALLYLGPHILECFRNDLFLIGTDFNLYTFLF